MNRPKDLWDKADIIAKFLIPIVVAGTAYLLNGQISERQASTEKSKLAIDILSVPAVVDESSGEDPLRRWAVVSLTSDFQFSEAERRLLLTGERSLPTLQDSAQPFDAPAAMEVNLSSGVLILSWGRFFERPETVFVRPIYVNGQGIPIVSKKILLDVDLIEVDVITGELRFPEFRNYNCGQQDFVSDFCASRVGHMLSELYVEVQFESMIQSAVYRVR